MFSWCITSNQHFRQKSLTFFMKSFCRPLALTIERAVENATLERP